METEIWPRFIREAKQTGARIAIVNGRLSERSASRYAIVGPFISSALTNVDLALMQGTSDAKRLASLGIDEAKVTVTGNMKFDLGIEENERRVSVQIRERFALDGTRPLIVAASTHEPEERYVLEAFCSAAVSAKPIPRLLIAPRHPERFDAVAKLIEQFRRDPANEWREYTLSRRSREENDADKKADVILLDTIGELRSVYQLAQIVFVGGSLISHGGQSILEPAAAGKAIITGPHTHNFADATKVFLANRGLVQLEDGAEISTVDRLFDAVSDLLEDEQQREELGRNARSVMEANRGATRKTVGGLIRLEAGS
jgi:3-deoxy-D-manno-octulosonic-acid transferase